MEVAEVPVEWSDAGGPKMGPLAMVGMAVDRARIALFYRLRLWTVRSTPVT
jgi:hypothetical protein